MPLDHQRPEVPVTSVRPADSRVFHRELDRLYPVMVRGKGYRVFDDEGNEYIDAVGGGAAVNAIGFGVDEVVKAAQLQLEVLPFIHNQKFTNPLQEELAEELLRRCPAYAKVIFCQGGGEANETALRLVRSYHVERGDPDRWRVISVAQAYHGSTMATLGLTGRPGLKYPYAPFIPDFPHIPPVDPEDDPDGQIGLERLEDLIREVGPETIAAYWCEPVTAAAGPGRRPPDGFFRGLDALREKYGFLVVFDEVVTGIGRTGTFLAADQLPIVPDIVTIAKGLGGGYVPMGAVMSSQPVYDAIAQGSRDFSHGYTFNGYPLGCAVGLAVLRYVDEHHLIERVATMGPSVLEMLRHTLLGLPFVQAVHGQGFLFGVTYRADDGSFLAPDLRVARRIDVAALNLGLLTYSTQPTSDGYRGDQTMLAPAFTTTTEDFDRIAQRLRAAIQRVASDVEVGAPLNLVVG
jgi:adenosylmethionine-8-amino-7-oxononanoate aminotransferase